jgi:hypothetical protein
MVCNPRGIYNLEYMAFSDEKSMIRQLGYLTLHLDIDIRISDAQNSKYRNFQILLISSANWDNTQIGEFQLNYCYVQEHIGSIANILYACISS